MILFCCFQYLTLALANEIYLYKWCRKLTRFQIPMNKLNDTADAFAISIKYLKTNFTLTNENEMIYVICIKSRSQSSTNILYEWIQKVKLTEQS